jgi:quercetin dioxygenase-like cupin family protein
MSTFSPQQQGAAPMHVRSNASPLVATLAEIPETNLVPAKFLTGGSIGAQIAYGLDSSIMVATRQPQYHSKPHAHDSEQLNYVLEGELYVFIDDDGFLVKKGDVFRIPRNAVHWSWVQGTTPCVLLEVHTPPLIGDPGVTDTARALLANNEDRNSIVAVASEWPANFDRDQTERKVMTTTNTELV